MRGIIFLFIFLLQLIISCSSPESECPDATCAQYATQAEAQAAYNSDRDCLGELDNDDDGIACEHLPAGGSSSKCPTTPSCGCSGKNMGACVGPCCKWTVGSGCGCS